jgi:hypothetical protein
MDHSEPECEVHPNVDACEKHSNSFSKTQQYSSVNEMQRDDSPEGCWFQERFSNTTTWEDNKSTIPFEDESEEQKIPQEMTDSNALVKAEFENKYLKQIGYGNGETFASSDQLCQQEPKECSSISFDNFSYLEELEEENDALAETIFDTAFEIEDDRSFYLELEGTDSEIQVAVNEIRKEAEKIDAILILDQFKTLQTDFDSVMKKCSLKTLENEELKLQLLEAENRVANMELERDLHQADAAKLREDLKTVVSKMFDISMYESPECVNENEDGTNDVNSRQLVKSLRFGHGPNDSSPNRICSHMNEVVSRQLVKRLRFGHGRNNPSPNTMYSPRIVMKNPELNEDEKNPASSTLEKMRIVGLIEQPRHMKHRLPQLDEPGPIRTTSHGQRGHFPDTSDTTPRPTSRQKQTLRNQNVFRNRSHHAARVPRTEYIGNDRKNVVEIPSDTRGDLERTVICHNKSLSAIDTKSTSLISENKEEEKSKKNKRCGMFFRRRGKQQSSSREDVSLLKQQISQLHEMMKTSLAASEKLRKRLVVISQYYEGVIKKLQTKIAQERAEKSRIQVDLANMVAQVDLERKLEKAEFEYQDHRGDERLARMGRDRGEV